MLKKSEHLAAVSCSSGVPWLGGVKMGLGLMGKLGRAWVCIGSVHGWWCMAWWCVDDVGDVGGSGLNPTMGQSKVRRANVSSIQMSRIRIPTVPVFCQKLKQSLFVEFITTFLCSKLDNQSHSTIFSIQGFCDEKNFLRIWNISNQISETFWFDFSVVALSYWVSDSFHCLVLLSQKAFTLGMNIHFGNWIHSDNACCINYPNLEN